MNTDRPVPVGLFLGKSLSFKRPSNSIPQIKTLDFQSPVNNAIPLFTKGVDEEKEDQNKPPVVQSSLKRVTHHELEESESESENEKVSTPLKKQKNENLPQNKKASLSSDIKETFKGQRENYVKLKLRGKKGGGNKYKFKKRAFGSRNSKSYNGKNNDADEENESTTSKGYEKKWGYGDKKSSKFFGSSWSVMAEAELELEYELMAKTDESKKLEISNNDNNNTTNNTNNNNSNNNNTTNTNNNNNNNNNNNDTHTFSDFDLQSLLQTNFGFPCFTPGQEETITSILSSINTLLISPTSGGKSLCYQFPPLIYNLLHPEKKSLTLVISPLLSLMNNQLENLPEYISGACLSSQQTNEKNGEVVSDVQQGKIQVLFVSPEKAVTELFIDMAVRSFPPIALACIDEAHCISEWSHNFRPSFLRLHSVLKERLKSKCILALTATATKKISTDIIKSLDIKNVVRVGNGMRSNIFVSVSMDNDRKQSLLGLLNCEPYSLSKSTIIYTMLQRETEEIAQFLTDHGITAQSYHAGKTNKEREKIQKLFMSSKLRVIVSTVAFGMGINKADIRCIVHYSLPRSVESYVQEIGRSGRDGKPSYCHLFLNEDDIVKLRSFAFSDGVEKKTLGVLLDKIFADTKESNSKKKVSSSRKNYCILPIDKIVEELDIKSEVIGTILTYLELDSIGLIRILPNVFASCNLNFHKTDPKALASKDAIVSSILAHSKKNPTKYHFELNKVCSALDIAFFEFHRELNKLKREGEISFELLEPAFYAKILQVPENLDLVLERISIRVQNAEVSKVEKVDTIFKLLKANSFLTYRHSLDIKSEIYLKKNSNIHDEITQYFTKDVQCENKPTDKVQFLFVNENEKIQRITAKGVTQKINSENDDESDVFGEDEEDLNEKKIEQHDQKEPAKVETQLSSHYQKKWPFVRGDLIAFLKQNGTVVNNARVIARIFHGISSPSYPASVWSKNPYWMMHREFPFEKLVEKAQEVIVELGF